MQKKPKKYTNQTKEEIKRYLAKLEDIVQKGDFNIEVNAKRQKNKDFIKKYNLNSKIQKEMLLSIDTLDFCYSMDDDENLKERLYVFSREYELNEWGITKRVPVFIKIVIKPESYAVIISFHEPERKIKKLFI